MYPQSEGDYNYNQLAESSYKLEQELRNEIEMLKDRLRLLQQTPCSTLRELLIQMYSSANDDIALLPNGLENDKRLEDLKAIQRVIRLMDNMKPVA